MLTIVMYHYVRPVSQSRYPALRALETRDFEGQLDYIARHYHVVTPAEVTDAAHGTRTLPEKSCLLSFDDGFLDHYQTVFPRLTRRGWSGCFFPVANASIGRRVLDVHKIQLILAVELDRHRLVRRLRELVSVARRKTALPSDEAMWETFARPNRFDGAELMFVKNALQHGLPQPLRGRLVDTLFAETLGQDEEVLARELYMDLEQMRLMAGAGMVFGGHGSHCWLGRASRDAQREDFRVSRALLDQIYGRPVDNWIMCYPHGSYNAETLELAREAGCCLGLTVEADVVRDFSRPLELPRLDTTDLPCHGTAEMSSQG